MAFQKQVSMRYFQKPCDLYCHFPCPIPAARVATLLRETKNLSLELDSLIAKHVDAQIFAQSSCAVGAWRGLLRSYQAHGRCLVGFQDNFCTSPVVYRMTPSTPRHAPGHALVTVCLSPGIGNGNPSPKSKGSKEFLECTTVKLYLSNRLLSR